MVPVAWCSSEAALYSHHECALSQVTGLVPQLGSTASYPNRSLVSSGGDVIVAVLRPVLFPKFASSNYKSTHTTHTDFCLSTQRIVFIAGTAECGEA